MTMSKLYMIEKEIITLYDYINLLNDIHDLLIDINKFKEMITSDTNA